MGSFNLVGAQLVRPAIGGVGKFGVAGPVRKFATNGSEPVAMAQEVLESSEEFEPGPDLAVVPHRTVLVDKPHQATVSFTGVAPRVLEKQSARTATTWGASGTRSYKTVARRTASPARSARKRSGPMPGVYPAVKAR